MGTLGGSNPGNLIQDTVTNPLHYWSAFLTLYGFQLITCSRSNRFVCQNVTLNDRQNSRRPCQSFVHQVIQASDDEIHTYFKILNLVFISFVIMHDKQIISVT